MTLLLELVALFVLARIFGELFERAKVPALAGEILAGLMLGPLMLGFIAPTDAIKLVADLGIFFIVYEAGMEMTLRGVRRIVRESGAAVAAGSFTLPFLLGFLAGLGFGFDLRSSLFLGLALSLTALPVSVRILKDLHWINTDVGLTIITAGLLCDIAGLTVLAVISSWGSFGGMDLWSATVVALKILFFFVVTFTVERLLSIRKGLISDRLVLVSSRLLSRGASFSAPLIAVFLFSLFAEFLGLHFVIGTFFGSVIVAEHLIPKREGEKVHESISAVSYGFLSPIFFAYLGLVAVSWDVSLAPLLGVLLTVAVVGKIAGSYIGARLGGFASWSSGVIAVGMNGRGAMELVIALVGLEIGIITTGVFSTLVLLGIVTTLMTSFMLRGFARQGKRKPLALQLPQEAVKPPFE